MFAPDHPEKETNVPQHIREAKSLLSKYIYCAIDTTLS